jgi:hypothetical protein
MKHYSIIALALFAQCSFAQWPAQVYVLPRQNGPIDYSSQLGNPLDSARRGFELGQAMRQEEERRRMVEQQRADQELARSQALQSQRLLMEQAESMQRQQRLLDAQAEELRRLREATAK